MWSVWCRVCRLHQPTFTPTYWRIPVVSIGKHLKNDHGLETIGDLTNNFSVLKCNGKLDCPIHEIFFIKKIRPCLNTQSDSISTKPSVCVTFYMHILRFIASYSTYYVVKFYSFSLEVTQMRAGQFVGVMFSRERNVVWSAVFEIKWRYDSRTCWTI